MIGRDKREAIAKAARSGTPTARELVEANFARMEQANEALAARLHLSEQWLRVQCGKLDELLTVAEGALGYLEALPASHRPDEAWFAPLRAAIAKVQS